jgi:hypothetical protein
MARKLIVRLKGGLGNQLFCYAAARRLAWANDAELVLDAVTGFKYDYKYKRKYALDGFSVPVRLATNAERMEPLGRFRRRIARAINSCKPLIFSRYIMQAGVDFDPDILTLRLQEGTTYFDPCGQSERYFEDISELIQRDLAMAAPEDYTNQTLAAQILATSSVALHLRWFDDGGSLDSSNMSLGYYAEAIQQLLAKVGKVHFFIFSDNPPLAEVTLSPLMQRHPYTVIQNNSENAEADFWLMRQCRHFIIGNSTFAWWAAWLGEHANNGTQIFVPGRNIDPLTSVTAWGFPGLLPDRWTVL